MRIAEPQLPSRIVMYHFDDTKRYIDGCSLSDPKKRQIFETNPRTVFPRLVWRFKEIGLLMSKQNPMMTASCILQR